MRSLRLDKDVLATLRAGGSGWQSRAEVDPMGRTTEAGSLKRVVLLLDNAGFHTLANLVVPEGLRLVYLPPCSPELHPAEASPTCCADRGPKPPPPAETLWLLVDGPIVNTLVPTLDALVDTIGARCCDLTGRLQLPPVPTIVRQIPPGSSPPRV